MARWVENKIDNVYITELEAHLSNHCCCGKAINITFWLCVCGLSYQTCKQHMLCYIVNCELWLYSNFPHYLTPSVQFFKKVIEHKTCVLSFTTFFVKNTSHSKKNSAKILSQMCIGFHTKYLLFLFDFNETWIFLTDFQKVFKYNVTKICSVEAELFHADGQTYMMKLIVALCKFANTPKNGKLKQD